MRRVITNNATGKATPYIPGFVLFFIALIVGLLVYKDYGISWDEKELRKMGIYTYSYVFHGDQQLFVLFTDHHGAAFQFFLAIIEKLFHLNDSRDIFLMRHLATHLIFLLSAFSLYVLIYNLHKNVFLACLGFIILLLSPRIYAHSYFNGGDIPFMSVFLIALVTSYFAFNKNKKSLFAVLGILCGFATGIRIMGIMLFAFILLFLFIDLVANLKNKKQLGETVLNVLFFTSGFCCMLYVSWPYLWKDPFGYFIASLKDFSHFPWPGQCLLNGTFYPGTNLPWTYFPTWFIISTPLLWLAAGFTGIIILSIDILKRPMQFLRNTSERNNLLYILCFFTPIVAVIFLHSVIYDDWRHLYFIYPSFILIGIYGISKIKKVRLKQFVSALCLVQASTIAFFMIQNHPFQQVYFNFTVSHKPEYLEKNYDLDYWGCSVKQVLEHLAATNSDTIKIKGSIYPIEDFTKILPKEVRARIKMVDSGAKYFITFFRMHPGELNLPYEKVYAIKVLNSTISCAYKLP